jgi:hypothetical protein
MNTIKHFTGLMLALGLLSPMPLAAQTMADCDDWRSSAAGIAEPWESNTKVFADGSMRLAIMDVGEPVMGSYRLLILTTTTEEPIERLCTVMSFDGDLGFAGLSFDGASDSTDPQTGLDIKIPAKRWIEATDTYMDAVLTVTVNAATGDVSGKLE